MICISYLHIQIRSLAALLEKAIKGGGKASPEESGSVKVSDPYDMDTSDTDSACPGQ